MRRRVTTALFATAAAGATIASLSFAAAGTASAARTPNALTSNSAGWAAGNILAPSLAKTSSTWSFRYASGKTMLPDVSGAPLSTNAERETFSVQLSNLKATYAAQMIQDTGVWTVQFIRYYQNGTTADDVTPLGCNPGSTPWTVGTLARFDVYYSQSAGTITFTAYSGPDQVCTDTEPAWNSGTLGGGAFTEAYAGGIFSPAATGQLQGDPYGSGLSGWTRPDADARLFAVSGVHVTSYNGTMGSVVGPWDYQQLMYGTSLSNDFADAPVLWNGGQNFGVWLRA